MLSTSLADDDHGGRLSPEAQTSEDSYMDCPDTEGSDPNVTAFETVYEAGPGPSALRS